MDGFIDLNKQAGESSHHAVAALRRLFHCKAGHCGTLDPQATGVLPLALGRATRLSEYVMGGEKRYIGEIRFGLVTDSYDAQGAVIAETDASFVTAAAVAALLPRFTGTILQAPPPVSALKRGGEPLYKKVRRGEQVVTEPRPVVVYALRLLDFRPDGAHPRCRVEICCGQGTYIRAIAHDLGQLLGCGAHLSALQRTQVGSFTLAGSYTLDEVAALAAAGRTDFLIPMETALRGMPAVTVADEAARLLAHGNSVLLPEQPDAALARVRARDGVLLGIGSVENGLVTMKKVLTEATRYDPPPQPLVACAIGFFDGLHLGHRALMEALYARKREHNGRSAVVTFSPHPLVLVRGSAPEMLTNERLKDDILRRCYAVDEVVTLHFDEALMNSTPEQFVDDVIVGKLGVSEIVVGYNFTYAAQGAGTPQLLREQCAARGVRVTVIDEVRGKYGPVSASSIRRSLRAGDLDAVNEMLGYWFAMDGEAARQAGDSGAPDCVALRFRPGAGQALPVAGVYAGRAAWGSAVHSCRLALSPDAEGAIRVVVYVPDAAMPPDSGTLRVWLGAYLRPARAFAGADARRAQLAADRRAAEAFLATVPPNQHLPKQIG